MIVPTSNLFFNWKLTVSKSLGLSVYVGTISSWRSQSVYFAKIVFV